MEGMLDTVSMRLEFLLYLLHSFALLFSSPELVHHISLLLPFFPYFALKLHSCS